jgi:hypothetical protein
LQSITLSSQWQPYTIPFAALRQQGFGYPSPTGTLDKQHTFAVHFQVVGPASSGSDAGVTFDFCLADISFMP